MSELRVTIMNDQSTTSILLLLDEDGWIYGWMILLIHAKATYLDLDQKHTLLWFII